MVTTIKKNINFHKNNGKFLIQFCVVKLGVLGIHTITCENCGDTRIEFNSCRNRHCPNCQAYAREKWIESKKEYLFKVQVLSSLFRGKFLAMLKEADLKFPKDKQYLKDKTNFNHFLQPLYKKTWITYIEPPKGKPENVIEYIGRYSFRVAISNERIKDISDGKITFEYKDYKDEAKIKTMTITAEEFIRRFLLHVLPDGFTKIRHYGILANRGRNALIKLCRVLIGTKVKRDFTITITRKLKEFICPCCGGKNFSYHYYYYNST